MVIPGVQSTPRPLGTDVVPPGGGRTPELGREGHSVGVRCTWLQAKWLLKPGQILLDFVSSLEKWK